ncbi:DNA cytosine methyltransferase [Aliarcobacter butzleri]|uniref:DNA cytosine methyltransferase n=1 Tax=Aliarcobacter butzleri TaxID=28197 RepID=UPI00263E65D0|nr:DNA cytosine methyltransferase [Aliarcobacter butzleri]MDN5104672.1 DNA cytosine methyltransferase [Aliarcobacter butzleri]
MVVLDLFSGAGGLSEGFWRQDCTFVGHVEADENACNTLKTRTAYWNLKKENKLDLYYQYLKQEISRDKLWNLANIDILKDVINKEIGEKTYCNIKERIKENLKDKNLSNVDVIIGGPPCQAYSIMGRASLGEKVKNDPRNQLFKYYVNFLEDFKPKMFVFENVEGFYSAGKGKYFEELKKAVDKAGYYMKDDLLIASDFGVLQSRKRVIIVGWQKELDGKCSYPKFKKINLADEVPTYNNVFDILNDLPPIELSPDPKVINEVRGENKYINTSNEYLEFSKIRTNNFNILTHHIARFNNENDREIYSIALDKWFNEKHRLQYKEIPTRLQRHKNKNANQNRFNVIKANEKIVNTIVAHISIDGHYYIHPDKKQLRSLSVREAARIQSFPDDFYFEGSRTATFKQIGNAVPPLMGETIAQYIKDMIYETR